MELRICDAEGCTNAIDTANRFDEEARRAAIGWTETTFIYVERRPGAPSPPPTFEAEMDLLHGEVTLKGEHVPFVIHKPKEVSEAEAAHDEWQAEQKRYLERGIVAEGVARLCAACSPKLPKLKAPLQARYISSE